MIKRELFGMCGKHGQSVAFYYSASSTKQTSDLDQLQSKFFHLRYPLLAVMVFKGMQFADGIGQHRTDPAFFEGIFFYGEIRRFLIGFPVLKCRLIEDGDNPTGFATEIIVDVLLLRTENLVRHEQTVKKTFDLCWNMVYIYRTKKYNMIALPNGIQGFLKIRFKFCNLSVVEKPVWIENQIDNGYFPHSCSSTFCATSVCIDQKTCGYRLFYIPIQDKYLLHYCLVLAFEAVDVLQNYKDFVNSKYIELKKPDRYGQVFVL